MWSPRADTIVDTIFWYHIKRSYYPSSNGYGFGEGIGLDFKYNYKGLIVGLTYSYTKSKRTGMFDPTFASTTGLRPHIFSLILIKNLPKNFDLSLLARYMSGCPYTPVKYGSGRYYTELGTYNSCFYPPYKRVDIRLAHKFQSEKVKFYTYLGLINVMDNKNVMLYIYERGTPNPVYMMPRIIVAGIRLTI